jgi:hypothetical protein
MFSFNQDELARMLQQFCHQSFKKGHETINKAAVVEFEDNPNDIFKKCKRHEIQDLLFALNRTDIFGPHVKNEDLLQAQLRLFPTANPDFEKSDAKQCNHPTKYKCTIDCPTIQLF